MTLKFNTVDILAHPNIEAILPDNYALGAKSICLKVAGDFTFKLTIDYLSPMGAAIGDFGLDSFKSIDLEFAITSGYLTPPLPTIDWQPNLLWSGGYLYIYELPVGKITIIGIQSDEIVYKAIFKRQEQIAALANKLDRRDISLAELISILQLAARSPNETVVTIDSVLKRFETNDGFLLDRISRTEIVKTSREASLNLGGNLSLALFLLYYLYAWRALPYAQQLDTGLEGRLVSVIKQISTQALQALDLRTGLVFSEVGGLVYARPSYLASVLSAILWHELASNYDAIEYRAGCSTFWRFYSSWRHNPDIESFGSYNLARDLFKVYLESEQVSFSTSLVKKGLQNYSDLQDCYQPLLCFLSDARTQLAYLQMPRMAQQPFSSSSTTKQALTALLKNAAASSLPYGYFWPTPERVASPGSIWGAFVNCSAAVGAITEDLLNTARSAWSLNYTASSNAWSDLLLDLTVGTPYGFWKQMLETFIRLPKFGNSAAEWLTYTCGFLPLTDRIVDYSYSALPPQFTKANSDSLTSINAADPNNLVTNADPIIYDYASLQSVVPGVTSTDIYKDPQANFASQLRPIDSNLETLDFTMRSNYLLIRGLGKPVRVREYLNRRTPVGNIILLETYTWGVAPSSRSTTSTIEVQRSDLFRRVGSPTQVTLTITPTLTTDLDVGTPRSPVDLLVTPNLNADLDLGFVTEALPLNAVLTIQEDFKDAPIPSSLPTNQIDLIFSLYIDITVL